MLTNYFGVKVVRHGPNKLYRGPKCIYLVCLAFWEFAVWVLEWNGRDGLFGVMCVIEDI